VCVCVCVFVRMSVCVYRCLSASVCLFVDCCNMYIRMFVMRLSSIDQNAYIHVLVYMYVKNLDVNIHVYILVSIRVYVNIYTRTHTYP